MQFESAFPAQRQLLAAGEPCTRKPAVCFIAHSAYGALTGGDRGHIGGVERQTSLMAKWFAAREYAVSMLTWDEGQPDDQVIDGVRVIKICRQDAGVPGIRFFHPRWTGLKQALQKAAADVYYHNCSECVTGQVALWCGTHARRFVYSCAANADVDLALPHMQQWHVRALYKYGLARANCIIVQTQTQRAMLRSSFGLDAVVLPMPCPGPSDAEYVPRIPPAAGKPILWIGRVSREKRPDRLLDMAEACPDLSFELVGPFRRTDYADSIRARALSLPNVAVRGAVPRQHIASVYQKGALLCCTSEREGFPNTFLEAWSHGLPVVTMFDPDHIVERACLGGSAKGVGDLIAAIRRLIDKPECWLAASAAAREYYRRRHTIDSAMPLFEHMLTGTLKS